MDRIRRNRGLLLAVGYAVLLVILFFSYLIYQPWHIIPELGGDGMKNTFTYLYHSAYGKGYWFTGMNYPYGEHIVYTDGQPLLSVFFASVGGVRPGTAMAVLWCLIALSYVVAVVYVYKILVHYGVNMYLAVLFAGLIVFYSPQFFRLRSHYALSYACIIPMVIYWSIRYFEENRRKYVFYMLLLGSIMAFIHPYYAAVLAIWVACYTVGYLLFFKARLKQRLRHLVPLYGAILLVFVLVGVVMRSSDPFTDRPATPYYTPETFTRLKQVVSSIHSPFWLWAKQHKLVYAPGRGGEYVQGEGVEGYAYAGMVCLITAAIAGLLFVIRRLKVTKDNNVYCIAGFPVVWLAAAACVLILSMGGPLIVYKDAINHLSFFKQFRSWGRFSWLYYYIIAIFTVLALQRLYEHLRGRNKAMPGRVVIVVAFAVWAFEASAYMQYSRDFAKSARYNYDVVLGRENDWLKYLNDRGFKREDFQAIIMLPYFHVGTEKLWIGDPSWEITLSAKAVLQLQLPLVNVMMSRSSWWQAQQQARMVAGPYADKSYLKVIKSRKPFLLLHFDEIGPDPDQRYLFKASDYVGHFAQCNVYVCYPDRIAANDRAYADSAGAAAASMTGIDTCIGCAGSYFVDHMDKEGVGIFGGGAITYGTQRSDIVARVNVPPVTDSQRYEFSAWFLLNDKDYRSPYVSLLVYDADGVVADSVVANTIHSTDNYGMWFRCSKYFYVRNNARRIECVLSREGRMYEAMDELQLRPAAATVISKDRAGRVMVNNHLLRQRNTIK